MRLIFCSFLVALFSFAWGATKAPFKIPAEIVQVGNVSTPDTKKVEFKVPGVASYPSIGAPPSYPQTLQARAKTLEVGENSSANAEIKFIDPGNPSFPTAASYPGFRWNKITDTLQFSNDGATWNNISDGSGISNWDVDASIVGSAGQTVLSASAITSWTTLSDTDLVLSNGSYANTTAQIACVSGEAPSGTTCTGNEHLGFAFTPPDTQDFEVCTEFSHYCDLNSGAITIQGFCEGTFAIVETASMAVTPIEISATKKNSAFDLALNATVRQDITIPHRICGRFDGSASLRTFRLAYKKEADVQVNNNAIITFLGFNRGDANVVFTAKNIKE